MFFSNESLDHIRFLFDDYKLSRWYFEVVDLYRRVLFTGILPLTTRLKTPIYNMLSHVLKENSFPPCMFFFNTFLNQLISLPFPFNICFLYATLQVHIHSTQF